MKLNGFAGEVLFIEEHIEENEMKYSNNELRERWKAIKRQAWNDDEFNEQVEKFEKYAVEEIQRVQENANIKLRLLEEKYKQDREEIMKGLYADEKEINDRLCEAFGLIVLVGNYGIGGFGSRGDDVAGLYLECIQYESK